MVGSISTEIVGRVYLVGYIAVRKSNIELLRIIAMFFIVMCHWGGHGSWNIDINGEIFVNKIFLQITQYFGEIGNCLFLLITGYFCVEKEKLSFKGIKRVVYDVKFYALAIWIIFLILHMIKFSIGGFVNALFPIIYNQYWFVAPYLTVYIFSPVINHVLNNFESKYVKFYLLLIFLAQLILPMIRGGAYTSNVAVFILFYSIGALIRKGHFLMFKENVYPFILVLLGFGSVIIISIIGDILNSSYHIPMKYFIEWTGRFAVFPIIGSMGIFLILLKYDFTSEIINKIAKSMFAVYLISENHYVYTWLWIKIFNNIQFYNSVYMIFIAILEVFIVMMVCVCIDFIYKYVVSATYKLLINIKKS